MKVLLPCAGFLLAFTTEFGGEMQGQYVTQAQNN
jgi:hypothetical protein